MVTYNAYGPQYTLTMTTYNAYGPQYTMVYFLTFDYTMSSCSVRERPGVGQREPAVWTRGWGDIAVHPRGAL